MDLIKNRRMIRVIPRNSRDVQRCIYIVDILNRFFVPCPSHLKDCSFDELRLYFYSIAPEY